MPMTTNPDQRIAELEHQLAILEANHRELGEQTEHLILLLSQARRELRETWTKENRDSAEGKN